MNILLVYPEYPETFWSFKSVLKYISKKAAYPPLGLMTIAALLPQEWSKQLVDVNVTKLKDEQIDWADYVFIGAMIIQIPSAQEIINRCKARGKVVVVGGPAATSQPEVFQGVDHFVLNEAEVTLPLFLSDLARGNAQPVYTSAIHPDISQTPAPLWSLINMKHYVSMPIQYSRGCPFNCEFCDIIILYGRQPRTKSPQQLLTEIQSLYDAGWRRELFIVDDNFIGNKKNVKAMLPHLIRWQKEHNYPFQIITEASVDLARDPELMKMMSQANFNKVFLGLETPSLDSLKECNKLQNTNTDLEESIRILHTNGLQVMGGFIVGFDSDTKRIFEDQIRFIQNSGVVTAMVGILNALPQTQLWHRLRREGRLLQNSSGLNTDANVNFIPRMGITELLEGYQKVISTIYHPRHYYQRIHVFLKNYQPTTIHKINGKDLLAAAKSMWKIGLLSRARFLYWKLLLKTALTRIKSLPTAVELAIMGAHFEKISRPIIRAKSDRSV
ncbi:MAG: Ribosomal protein S12 methylthiotransferase RimO [Planctomycetes bacterium ADurb.Bin412]|nr:MAG: Ribosomal protein S12 methylthiotransferase RimO [Planctomycetes bacterium ADurb.Bin412]